MKRWFWALLVVLGLLVVLSVRKGVEYYRDFRRFSSKVRVEQIGKAGALVVTSKGSRGGSWRLEAKVGNVIGTEIVMKDVHIVYCPKESTSCVDITGVKGTFDRKKRRGKLEGNVVVRTNEWKITSQTLLWFEKENRVCFPDNFLLKGRYLVSGRDGCVELDDGVAVVKHLYKVVLK